MKIIGIAGFSGSGKTTLIEKLIPALTAQGLTVSLIKHAHHDFDIDKPGKDSHRHRVAGAVEVMVSSRNRWALMHELRDAPEPSLQDLLKQFTPCDVVIVEGWKHEPIAKIEVHRKAAGNPLLHMTDANVVAIATDVTLDSSLPQFSLDDVAGIAQFIVKSLGLRKTAMQIVK